MQTVVVTGGTDGLGKGIALHYLKAGARVLAIGSTQAKGEALIEEAREISAAGRIHFLSVDLTSVAGSRRLVEEIEDTYTSVDKLVLCAQRYRLFGKRSVTPEGFEYSFALAYLSRFVLSYGLLDALQRTKQPVIMNVGTPGVGLGSVHWDDLQFERGYNGNRATLQSFRANDLLGVGFAAAHGTGPVTYIGYNPGVVSTGMPNSLPLPLRLMTRAAFALAATPVERAIKPMVELLDNPPSEPFVARWKKKPVDLGKKAFDAEDALRLKYITEQLVGVR
ncbi:MULTISPECIES: SDR family NAD(P)-dependent oxidoreductase [unclassified Streptomyces]|uniref:SDR family NAD(P)-dependent oxidoreductase n=1 Tax=unclassified Streptomyces TaxID=2593676 RepID=UPI0013E05309|nr:MULTISPECIES: SDR family NAD(P)-dependent oxidoreductase [unclassified Streptomyces]